jgi:hypothetical protein
MVFLNGKDILQPAIWVFLSLNMLFVPLICSCEKGQNIEIPLTVLVNEKEAPLVTIYTESGGMDFHPEQKDLQYEPKVIAAFWKNGNVLWSKDQVNGGPPYFGGKVDLGKVSFFLKEMKTRKYFNNEKLADPHFGPDSSSTTIAILNERQWIHMQSWHELAEQDPRIVATSDGLISVGSRSRSDILMSQPGEYKYYRETWDVIKKEVIHLIPGKGISLGELHFRKVFVTP